MPSLDTGKQRAQRIELDYYRQRGGLAKWKVAVAIAATMFGIVAIVYSAFNGSVANPGDLAQTHAHFEHDCAKCHEALTPIANGSVRDLSVPPLLEITEAKSVHNTFDKCTTCHNGPHSDGKANPIANHYNEKLLGDWGLIDENCALCHADHQGRDFDLTNVTNTSCVVCHGRLSDVCDSSQQVVQKDSTNENITTFTKEGHGDFMSLKAGDQGRIKFDHAQHLQAGQSEDGEDGKDAMTLDKIGPEMQSRYSANENGLVQLECKNCHQFDGVPGEAESLTSASDLGRSMQPISFDEHCSACHHSNPAGRVGALPIPHAAPWTEVDQWVAARIAIKKKNAILGPTGIGSVAELPETAQWSGELTDSQIRAKQWMEAAEKSVLIETMKAQCETCHVDDLTTDAAIKTARDSVTPMIPSRWLQHGIYDHAAHVSVACHHCHKNFRDGEPTAIRDGDPKTDPNDHKTLMIDPSIATCVNCHRGAETKPNKASAATFGGHVQWASDSCVLCHRYHTTKTPQSTATADAGAAE